MAPWAKAALLSGVARKLAAWCCGGSCELMRQSRALRSLAENSACSLV
jgi:hypothetical protein